ncbi:putative YLP motif containing 1, partial [Operophtera brumata]
MAWSAPNHAQWNSGMAGMPMQDMMNSGSFTPEQWALMQQQNWQQWTQWQQQYSQWQNQFGDKYAQQLQAVQSMGGIPPPPPVGAVPPPPPDKPPPPPPHENNQPLFNNKDKPSPTPTPPVQRNNTNYNTNSGTGNNQWSYSTDPQPAVNAEALKKLAEEERLFDIQFQKWEEEIDKWRQENVNHPDKQAYKDYESKFEACRKQLLERRQQMKTKRATLLNNPTQPTTTGNTSIAPSPSISSNQNSTSQIPQSQNTPQNKSYERQYDSPQSSNIRNNTSVVPQDRYESYHQSVSDSNNYTTHGNHAPVSHGANKLDNSTFLPTASSGKGIPGLDLVPDSHANKKQEVIDLSDDQPETQGKAPDYSTISMGISNILGDEKIMNILSLVRSYQPAQETEPDNATPSAFKNDNRNQNFNQSQQYGDRQSKMPNNRQGQPNQDSQYQPPNQGGNYNRQDGMQQDQIFDQNNHYGGPNMRGPGGTGGPRGPGGSGGPGPSGPHGHSMQQGNAGMRQGGPTNFGMNQSGPGMHQGGPGMKPSGPGMQQGGPGMRPSGPGMHQGGPMQQGGPGMRPSGPGMHQGGPMQQGGPGMRPSGPGMHPGGPMQQGGPSMRPSGPGMRPSGPGMQQGGLGTRPSGPGNQQGPGMRQSGPNMQHGGPNMQQGGSNMQQGSPNMQQGGPNMQQPPPLMGNRISNPSNGPGRPPLQDVSSQQNADYYGGPQGGPHSAIPPPQPPKPKWVEDPLFTPSIVVEYEHKPLRLKARDFIEPVHTFDYNHISKDNEYKKKDFEHEADELFTRKPRRSERDNAEDRFRDQGHRDLYQRDYERRGTRDDFRDMPKDIREIRGEPRDTREPRGLRDMREPRDMREQRDFRDVRGEQRDFRGESRDYRGESIDVREPRERDSRDDSNPRDRPRDGARDDFERRRDDRYDERKRDDRDRYGNRRVLNDDQRDRDSNRDFNRDRRDGRRDENRDVRSDDNRDARRDESRDSRRDDNRIRSASRDEDSRKRGLSRESDVKKQSLKYEYDAASEETYTNSLKRAFKRSLTDGYFSFLIYDAANISLQNYADIWNFSRQSGFQVYICTMEQDVQTCLKRNIHNRTLDDLQVMASRFFPTPVHHIQLDATTLLQNAAIEDVHMEDVDDVVMIDDLPEAEVESVFTSKWEKMDDAAKLARLDGTSKPLRPSQLSMEDYLQIDDWTPNKAKPGKKT